MSSQKVALQRSVDKKFQQMAACLNEHSLRLWAAVEAKQLGRGGVSILSRATGLSRTTIHAGLQELESSTATDSGEGAALPERRIRRQGGGRKPLSHEDPTLLKDLELLVDPVTRGDPESPLRWTCKSSARLAAELSGQGHRVSPRSVYGLLESLGYSLQSVRKTREGAHHPDRDEQFRHIAGEVAAFQKRGYPVISVDTKKKELIGDFGNSGREWQPKGRPEEVRVHDFIDKTLGKAIPYGVYDLKANQGWVSVGVDHDTAEFAVEAIRQWWRKMGRRLYPQATELLITADGGGSNGSRVRLWKRELQGLANELGLEIHVCHFPPGTSKWNKIEHRMFCHITQNWRGRPLINHEVVVQLIGSTTTEQGLKIRAQLDKRRYDSGIKVTKDEMKAINLKPDEFHGNWNYMIAPQ